MFMSNSYDPLDLSQYSKPRRPASELAFQALRRAILDGYIAPNERLMAEELAARMGVSRTPVREALRKLELEGLVRTEPWRGVMVAEQRLEDMEEFYAIRGALEGVVAHFAARKRNEQRMTALAELMQQMEETVHQNDTVKFSQLQVLFYDEFISMAGSNRLKQMVGSIRDYLERAKPVSLSAPGRLKKAFEELRDVIRAIERGDPDAAEEAARLHCRLAYDAFRSAVKLTGKWRPEPTDRPL